MPQRQDLDQMSTFSEILDSLKNYPAPDQERDKCTMYTITRQNKNISYMAPLGPSQVDIGNLNTGCSCHKLSEDPSQYKARKNLIIVDCKPPQCLKKFHS